MMVMQVINNCALNPKGLLQPGSDELKVTLGYSKDSVQLYCVMHVERTGVI